MLYKEPLKLFDKSRKKGLLQLWYCHECAESDVNYIHSQSSYNRVVVSKYNLLMEGIKIYNKKIFFIQQKRILISNFNIF